MNWLFKSKKLLIKINNLEEKKLELKEKLYLLQLQNNTMESSLNILNKKKF